MGNKHTTAAASVLSSWSRYFSCFSPLPSLVRSTIVVAAAAAAPFPAAPAAIWCMMHPSIVSFLRDMHFPLPPFHSRLTSPTVTSTKAATNSITARIFFFSFSD